MPTDDTASNFVSLLTVRHPPYGQFSVARQALRAGAAGLLGDRVKLNVIEITSPGLRDLESVRYRVWWRPEGEGINRGPCYLDEGDTPYEMGVILAHRIQKDLEREAQYEAKRASRASERDRKREEAAIPFAEYELDVFFWDGDFISDVDHWWDEMSYELTEGYTLDDEDVTFLAGEAVFVTMREAALARVEYFSEGFWESQELLEEVYEGLGAPFEAALVKGLEGLDPALGWYVEGPRAVAITLHELIRHRDEND